MKVSVVLGGKDLRIKSVNYLRLQLYLMIFFHRDVQLQDLVSGYAHFISDCISPCHVLRSCALCFPFLLCSVEPDYLYNSVSLAVFLESGVL
jgi:hypothetical protein